MKRILRIDDRADVADWLTSLMDRAHDLADITVEATKPRQERTLSRAALRRDLDVTFAELRALCRAGRRGIRAPRRTR